MKLLVSDSTLTLCEHLLRRYEELTMEGFLDDAPADFRAWVSDAHAEVRATRHKFITGVRERTEQLTEETLGKRAL